VLLIGQGSITNAYRVEASGWDSTQSLFVETYKLKCSMFQPETLSRPEAKGAFAEISKQLKIGGLLRPFFGTVPALAAAAKNIE
jgi:hypothetical protein